MLDSSVSASAALVPSLLVSSSNPKAIGVTLQSNTIADCDNNDILLGLVAMFRHADRTPKQKVKLKTKSQVLIQLFDDQLKEKEKESGSGNVKDTAEKSVSAGSATPSSASRKKQQQSQGSSSSSLKKNPSSLDLSNDKSLKKNPSLGDLSAPPLSEKDSAGGNSNGGINVKSMSDGTIGPKLEKGSSLTDTSGKEKEKEKKFEFKDLKYKKKGDILRIKEAVKILVVKEQLREKRKRKAAALAAAAEAEREAAAQATKDEEEHGETGGSEKKEDGETQTETNTDANANATAGESLDTDRVVPTPAVAPSPELPSSTLDRAGSSTNTTSSNQDWSDDDLAIDPSSAVIGPDGSLDDELIEAAISAEQAKEREKDAQKDPEYLSKLFQILSVLDKGYGGVKVQLKPKKVENNKVTQVLLIVKWGGEMTHAGVGQARQYAAAFWDDMIPPPYVHHHHQQSTSLQPQNQVKPPHSSGPKAVGINSIAHPGTTTMLASMANTNADGSSQEASATPTAGATDSSSSSSAASSAPALTVTKSLAPIDVDRAIQAAMLPDTNSLNHTPAIEVIDANDESQPPPSGMETSPTSVPSVTVSTEPPSTGSDPVTTTIDDPATCLSSPHSHHNSAGQHEFAYDHNSSLTQGDRAKLKSQLQAARAAGSKVVNTIPEHSASNATSPSTPNTQRKREDKSMPAGGETGNEKETQPPPVTSNILPVASLFPPPANLPPGSTRKAAHRQSTIQTGAGSSSSSSTSASTQPSSASLSSSTGSSSTVVSPTGTNAHGVTPIDINMTSSSGAITGASAAIAPGNASVGSAGPSTTAPTMDDRLIAFRRQRLAFFQGLQIYSSDEARVVASAEAFYTSTFEHAHGLTEVTPEQLKDRDEKKKIQSIRDWIEQSRKTQIRHDKQVQEYLDDTSMCADSMARAKEGVKYILMSESGLTPAQVTRHMLAQEQIARATSEAERADILKEEEESLRSARAEAEAREREEQVEAVSLKKQQIAEEQMEQLLDRLAELEEDGMNLETKLTHFKECIKEGSERTPDYTIPSFNEKSSPSITYSSDVVKELEALLAKIYVKLQQEYQQKQVMKNKKWKKRANAEQATGTNEDSASSSTAAAATALTNSTVGGIPIGTGAIVGPGTTGSSQAGSSVVSPTSIVPVTGLPGISINPSAPSRKKISPPTPPSITPPPSPSSFGPTALTEWTVRCLRWIGKPKLLLVKLYELLLQLQAQIHSKCEWAEKNTPPAPTLPPMALSSNEEDDTNISSTKSDPSSSSSHSLSRGSIFSGSSTNLTKDLTATGSGSSAPASASSSSKAKASTEFEYVYEWEGSSGTGSTNDANTTAGTDDNGEGSSGSGTSKVNKMKRPQATRFGLGHLLCHKETLFLMKSRWDNLISSFYDVKTNSFDPTKIPDVYGQSERGSTIRKRWQTKTNFLTTHPFFFPIFLLVGLLL